MPYLDTQTRKLLEWKILKTAMDLLGDVEDRLLLSCPPPLVCKGNIELGQVEYERSLWPFALRESDLLQHIAIFGRSGSGKSNAVFQVLRQLVVQRVPFLFLDWKRTARHLLPSLGAKVQLFTPGRSLVPFHFNPFLCPPGSERHSHISLVVDLLGRAFTLGDGAKSILHRVLSDSSASPTVAELLAHTEAMDTTGRKHGWKASAVRCLQTLLFTDAFAASGQDQINTVEQFFSTSCILELNGLNENAKRFLIPALLHWLYQVRLGTPDRERLRLVVVLEEAHHVLGDRQSEHFFGRFLRQCRELGIGVVLVDQAPSLMSSVALGNSFATICLNLKDPADMRVASGLLGLREPDRPWLSSLRVGQSIIKLQDRWTSPFVLQFPLVTIRKGSMIDESLRLFLAEQAAGSARSPAMARSDVDVRDVRLTDEVGGSTSMEFLLDVAQHPDSGVKERYRRLRWSVDKGNRVKNQLLKAGLLEGSQVSLGTTRRLLLRVSAASRRLLRLGDGATLESITHAFWKRRLAQQCRAEGWHVEVEGFRDPQRAQLGRADVLITRGNLRCAVEVETGKSNVIGNVRNGLLARLTRILVVATTDEAFDTVARSLSQTGLLGSTRVTISRAPVSLTFLDGA